MAEENQKKKGGCLKSVLILIGIIIVFSACMGALGGGEDTDESAGEASPDTATEESTDGDSGPTEEDLEERDAMTSDESVEEDTEESVEEDTAGELENKIREFAEGEAAMEEVNEITVEQNDDGHYVMIDYLHYDNPSGYAYLVQIESLIEKLTNELEGDGIAELEYIAEARLVRDGEDVQDTVYEAIFNDISGVNKDNIEEKAGYVWMSGTLEE